MMRAIGLSLWVTILWMSVLGSGCSMSQQPGSFSQYPQQVLFGAATAQRVYVQQSGYYAVHYAQPEAMNADAAASGAIGVMEEEGIAVFSGSFTERKAPTGTTFSPVYALQPNGTLAVPTGKIFVRFPEQIAIETRQAAIEAAGYELVDRPAYAPSAGWVRARSGAIADGLKQMPHLMTIPDIANVEPQMLMQRSLR